MQSQQDPELMREPGYGTLQHYWAMPYFVLARFGRWDELLAEPRPAEDLLYPTGIWHYARGLAWARNDDRERARSSLAALVVIADDPDMDSTRIWETHSMAQILAIAREILSGELALASGEHEKAIAHLEQAVRLEDDLVYVEPPDWYVPARHNLGAALLTAGRAADAEAVYRRDLEVYPGNGWSLRGLERALRAQGRELDADAVADRFQKVWAQADIEIQGSRL
jgi:tetratricopeptide (TPR) repeat protein